MKANEDQEAGRAGLREHLKPGTLLGPPFPPPLALLLVVMVEVICIWKAFRH